MNVNSMMNHLYLMIRKEICCTNLFSSSAFIEEIPFSHPQIYKHPPPDRLSIGFILMNFHQLSQSILIPFRHEMFIFYYYFDYFDFPLLKPKSLNVV